MPACAATDAKHKNAVSRSRNQCNSAQDKYCTGLHMSRGLPRRPAAQPSSRISALRAQNLPPRLDSFSQVDSASHLHNGATPTDHGQLSAVLPTEACSSCFCGPSHPPFHTLHAHYSGYLNVSAHASMSILDLGATVQPALAALPHASRRHAPRKRRSDAIEVKNHLAAGCPAASQPSQYVLTKTCSKSKPGIEWQAGWTAAA